MHLRAFVLLVALCAGVPRLAVAAPPIGWLDTVNGEMVVGWGLDPDTPTQPITIHFYIDGPAGQGKFAGMTVANAARPDVNQAFGVPGDHGFSWRLPAGFAGTPRQLYAYAIDSSGDKNNVSLTGSPLALDQGSRSLSESTILGAINMAPAEMPGAKTISGKFRNSTIALTTADAFAGAIFSLTWNGKTFINSYDHGRGLQSAATFDGSGECFNPTEAGSSDDMHNPASTSQLISVEALGNVLRTRTQMAFWLKPGQRSPYCGSAPLSTNTTTLSSHFLDKTVTLGFQGMPNVIEHKVTFHVTERHSSAVFEAVTAYMPASFSQFLTYDPAMKSLAPLSDGPGEQGLPVILATADGSYAMGVYSPDQPQLPGLGYGRYRFDSQNPADATTKWNCLFREKNITVRDYTYRCYSIVGTLNDVTNAMTDLDAYFRAIPADAPHNEQPGSP